MVNIDIPQIAKFLFNIYPTDALEFEAIVPKKVIELMPKIFPESNPLEIDRMTQILKIQTLAKFCHISENLGATALAFKSVYDDFQSEILGLFNTMFNYQVAHVIKFYEEIEDKDNDYIATIYGHQSIMLQEQESKKLLQMSCRNIKRNFEEIGGLYVKLEPLYNAYKHGYRLLLGKEDEKNTDVVVFVAKGGNEEHVLLDNEVITNSRKLISRCRTMLDGILENHRTRLEDEGADYNIFPGSNRVQIDSNGKKIIKQRLMLDDGTTPSIGVTLQYTARGSKLRQLRRIGNSIYKELKNNIKIEDQGKLIAIDIDSKRIVAIEPDIDTLISSIIQSNITGRVIIRKVGDDPRTGLPIY